MSKNLILWEQWSNNSQCTPWNPEVCYTLETMRLKVEDALSIRYCDSSYPDSLSRWNHLWEVLKIALDRCVWRRNIELEESHAWPYTLDEIKAAIWNVSWEYHCRFNPEEYNSIEELLQKWIKSFPGPEFASERNFMNALIRVTL